MPQGGVDAGEDLEVAALRELAEETGVSGDKVTLLKQTAESIRYDLPDELIGKLWKGKYRGQEQVWFLARFNGEDAEIDLEAHDPPEFSQWKWLDPEELPDVIVPFKKHIYRAVLEEFRDLI
jgi:putative (di)nucleoside polyphosphate hydrolase